MKKAIIAVILMIVCLYAVIYEKSGDTIVVYTSMEHNRNEGMTEQLRERFPDYDIQVMYLPTAKVAAKLRSEGTNTDADIIVGVETGYLEMVKDSLGNALDYTRLDYLLGINPEHGKYVIWEAVGGGFAVNTDILAKYNLPEPKSYEDLLNPIYKDLIALQDPKSSSTGYNFYLSLVNELGFEGALEYYDKLNENVKQYSESGSGPVKMLIQGEVAVGTALTFNVTTEINNGHPLKMIYPEQGSPTSYGGTSFIKGRESDPRIMEVFDFLINDFILYDKAYYNPGKIVENQIVMMDNWPKDIPVADMTGLTDMNKKQKLLKAWKF